MITAPLLKRLNRFEFRRRSNYPYLSGDTFRAIAEIVVDDTKRPIPMDPGDKPLVIFVQQTRGGNQMNRFFNEVRPQLKSEYVLLTHNGMTPDWSKFEHHLDDPQMLAWLGKNLEYRHPKAETLPLGVINPCDAHDRGRMAGFWNEFRMNLPEKDIQCYLNFGVGHKKQARRSVRLETLEFFEKQPFVTCFGEKSWQEYAEDMARSRFIICPPGEAIDTYRVYEAMYLNAIPIVYSTPIDRLYEQYPIWIVKDWSEVTEDQLESKWAELSPKLKNCQPLWANYWISRILDKTLKQ